MYLIIRGLMGITGLGLRFAVSGEFAHGLGMALVLFAGVGLMVDDFAERRAYSYASVLKGESASLPQGAPAAPR
jgi:hypothetical protein